MKSHIALFGIQAVFGAFTAHILHIALFSLMLLPVFLKELVGPVGWLLMIPALAISGLLVVCIAIGYALVVAFAEFSQYQLNKSDPVAVPFAGLILLYATTAAVASPLLSPIISELLVLMKILRENPREFSTTELLGCGAVAGALNAFFQRRRNGKKPST